MAFTTLISTSALAMHVDDPAFAIVDCRFSLADTGWGAREYAERHIPDAVYADIDRDLSGPKNGRNGRHPLPDAGVLAGTLGRLGIAGGVQVVAYDQDTGMYASRLWWLLRWLGHSSVAVLDGGFAKWNAEGRPTTSGEERRETRSFTGRPHEDLTFDAARVGAIAADPRWRLVDARAPERYRGEQETLDPVAGHIPGASNQFYMDNLTGAGLFRTPEELRARFAPVLEGRPADRLVAYCGSGVTACHDLLALEHAGLHGARLYPGSWSEWCADPARPVATGDEDPRAKTSR